MTTRDTSPRRPDRGDPFLASPPPPAAPRRPFTRRRFLAGAGAAGAAVAAGTVLGHYLGGPGPTTAGLTVADAPLVLITLYGGNDGLNTVIPHADGTYTSIRPTLGYKPEQVLDLGEGLGLNPQLKGLHSLWQAGRLAVVRGVGYPNPNLSHFASMAIWQTANVTDGTGSGWLGRWLDRTASDGVFDPMLALSLGATLPPALRGEQRSATAITTSHLAIPGGAAFQSAFAALQTAGPDRTGLAGAVAASGADLLAARTDLDRLHQVAAAPSAGGSPAALNGPTTTTGRPGATAPGPVPRPGRAGRAAGSLAAQMEMVAGLIRAGAPTRLYQVSLSSFDTHADEKANHERLLADLDTAVTALLQDLAGHPVVIMTYSEFGRRPAENASGGTDHGTAAPLFVIGDRVKGGRFYGDEPSLTSLDGNGNLLHTVDFRSVYATVLDRVLGSDPEPVLGGRFPTLPFL